MKTQENFRTMLPKPQVVKRVNTSIQNPLTGESLIAKKHVPLACRIRTI